MVKNMHPYQIQPGQAVKLKELDPHDSALFGGGKKEAKAEIKRLNRKLEDLQELLYAEHRRKVLIVLQGMDAGGKDGTVRHVFEGVNPQGVKVTSFKVPTDIELDHDYLWRVHRHTPGKGEIVIFNRSHYEDVLVVRVKNLVPKSVWKRRYRHINAFERMLTDEGTTLLKFYLNISYEEQKTRFQARLDNPKKQWKFRLGDLADRKRWPEYMKAYEEMLSRTSTAWAPWHVIPADRKWYRNLVIARILVETLENLDMTYPPPEEDVSGVVVK